MHAALPYLSIILIRSSIHMIETQHIQSSLSLSLSYTT